jgi:hypothetical protein
VRRINYLAAMTAAARKAGCKTGAEISHTVLDRERATGEFIDTIQTDIWGNRLGRLVCHNNPDIRAYLAGMFTDLAANYDVDYIVTAILPMAFTRPPVIVGMGGERHKPGTVEFGFWGSLPADFREALLRTTLGGCFCEHCQKAASAQGMDLKAVRRAMLPLADMVDHATEAEAHRLKLLSESSTSAMAMLVRHAEIFDLVKFRCETMAGLYQHLHNAMLKGQADNRFPGERAYRNVCGIRRSRIRDAKAISRLRPLKRLFRAVWQTRATGGEASVSTEPARRLRR